MRQSCLDRRIGDLKILIKEVGALLLDTLILKKFGSDFENTIEE